VKLRGFRIELGDVEATITGHSGVKAAVAVALENRSGDRRLVAYVVADETSPPSPDELRRHVQNRLPEYMVPSAFVMLNELPLNANGKLNRRALPVPEHDGMEANDVFVGPRTLVEERLADIWSEVLGLEKVGIYDNFFALGGHSLLTTQLIARVGKAFDIDIELRSIFEMPTVAELAVSIEEIITREIEQLSEEEAEDLAKMADFTRD
jgi:acyl carrier protein